MNLFAIITDGKRRLRDAGIPAFSLDATVLASYAFSKSRERQLLDGHEVPSSVQTALFYTYIERRAAFEPVAYITGEKPFRRHIFSVSHKTLIPRPDSECLLDAAEDDFKHREGERLNILDICTGSGCLLLSALAVFPHAYGVGTDISFDALRVAQHNIFRTDTQGRAAFALANWTEGISGRFDIIFCNPPYISQADKQLLSRDITEYEPDSALFAGSDGMDAYRVVFPTLSALLAPRGAVFMECGDDQTDALTQASAAAGLRPERILYDLSGAPRGVVFY